MAYLQHSSWKDRPGAVAGVIAVHAAVGYALVTGLSFSKIVETVKNPEGIFVPEVKLPPPPPPPEPTVEPTQEMTPPVHAPTPPVDLGPQRPPIETTPVIVPLPTPVPIPYVQPKVVPQPGPTAKPSFDAVGAKPRNDPGSWVTVDDYRSAWINREWTGAVRFRLSIGANGRVENCTITDSSGHAELDEATCKLVTSRARFDAARDETGAKVGGTYTNTVRWELPT